MTVTVKVSPHFHQDMRTPRLKAAYTSVEVRRAELFPVQADADQERLDAEWERLWRGRVDRNAKERRRLHVAARQLPGIFARQAG